MYSKLDVTGKNVKTSFREELWMVNFSQNIFTIFFFILKVNLKVQELGWK